MHSGWMMVVSWKKFQMHLVCYLWSKDATISAAGCCSNNNNKNTKNKNNSISIEYGHKETTYRPGIAPASGNDPPNHPQQRRGIMPLQAGNPNNMCVFLRFIFDSTYGIIYNKSCGAAGWDIYTFPAIASLGPTQQLPVVVVGSVPSSTLQ